MARTFETLIGDVSQDARPEAVERVVGGLGYIEHEGLMLGSR